MFCPKCGANNPEDVKFCGVCGEPLNAVKENAPVKENVGFNNGVQPQGEAAAAVKKKKPKKKKGVIAGVVIAVVLAVAALCFAFWPRLARLAVGEAKFYFMSEARTVKSVFESSAVEKAFEAQSVGADAKLKLTIDGEELECGNIKLAVDEDSGKMKLSADVPVTEDGEETISVRIDYADGIMTLSVPDLSEECVSVDLAQYEKLAKDKDTSKQLTNTLNDTLSAIQKDVLKGDRVESVRYELDGKKYSAAQFTIDDEAVNEMAKIVLNEFVKSDFVKGYVEDTLDMVKEQSPELAEELEGFDFNAQVDELIEEIDEYPAEFDEELVYTVCYSGSGKVVARVAEIEDYTVTLVTDIGSKETKIRFTEEYDGEKEFEFELNAKTEKGAISGSAKYTEFWTYEGEERSEETSVKFSDVKAVSCGGVYVLTGKASLTLYDEKVGTLTASADGDKYTITVETDPESEYEDFKAELTATLTSSPDVSDVKTVAPKDAITVEEFFGNIYGGVTNNALNKTCENNIKMIKNNVANFYASYDMSLPTYSDLERMFEYSEIPECPLGGEYTIAVRPNGSAEVMCPNCSDSHNVSSVSSFSSDAKILSKYDYSYSDNYYDYDYDYSGGYNDYDYYDYDYNYGY
ncbi:MAG: zinc ribbon domain-containing protein [Candidatus Fimenecus sp.]